MSKTEYLHEGHRERVRKKFLVNGFSSIVPDHEILEMILFYSIPRKDTNELAHKLINYFGSLFSVLSAPVEELTQIDGISENTAVLLNMFFEVVKRYKETDFDKKEIFHTSDDAGNYLLKRYEFFGKEEVFTLTGTNNLGEVVTFKVVEKGDIASVGISLRKVLELILKSNCTSVIIAHNHPSGIALPSDADIKITASVRDVLKTVGVKLTDHIILVDNDFVSLAQSEHFKSLFK